MFEGETYSQQPNTDWTSGSDQTAWPARTCLPLPTGLQVLLRPVLMGVTVPWADITEFRASALTGTSKLWVYIPELAS